MATKKTYQHASDQQNALLWFSLKAFLYHTQYLEPAVNILLITEANNGLHAALLCRLFCLCLVQYASFKFPHTQPYIILALP